MPVLNLNLIFAIRELQICVLKPQDVLIVLKLASFDTLGAVTFKSLGESLSMSASEVLAGTRRAAECRLLLEEARGGGASRFRICAPHLREFLTAGLRYVFPGRLGTLVRGFRTAQDAPPLDARLASRLGEPPIVWPHAAGDTRGLALAPLYPSAPDAALRDEQLYRWLALADALRTGDARIRSLAATETARLLAHRPS